MRFWPSLGRPRAVTPSPSDGLGLRREFRPVSAAARPVARAAKSVSGASTPPGRPGALPPARIGAVVAAGCPSPRGGMDAPPDDDDDDDVCLSPPPTRSAGAPEALGEPWTARSSTARARGPSTPPPSRRAAAAGSPAEPSDDEVFCLAPPPTRSARTPEAPGEPSSSRFFSVAAAAAAAARPPRAAPRTRATTSSFACRLRRPRRGPGPRHRCRGRLSRPRASGRRRATLRPRRAPAPRTRATTSDDHLSPPRHARRTAVRFRGGAEVAHVARRRAWTRSRPAAGRLARRAIAIAWVL